MRSEPDKDEPFGFEGPEIIKCKGYVCIWYTNAKVVYYFKKISDFIRVRFSGALCDLPLLFNQEYYWLETRQEHNYKSHQKGPEA